MEGWGRDGGDGMAGWGLGGVGLWEWEWWGQEGGDGMG